MAFTNELDIWINKFLNEGVDLDNKKETNLNEKTIKSGPDAMKKAKAGDKLVDTDGNPVNDLILIDNGYIEKDGSVYTITKIDPVNNKKKVMYFTKKELDVISSGYKKL